MKKSIQRKRRLKFKSKKVGLDEQITLSLCENSEYMGDWESFLWSESTETNSLGLSEVFVRNYANRYLFFLKIDHKNSVINLILCEMICRMSDSEKEDGGRENQESLEQENSPTAEPRIQNLD